MKKSLLSSIAALTVATSAMAVDISNSKDILEKVAQLPVAKAHSFIPTKLRDAGSLYQVKGYFNTPRGKMDAMVFVSPDYQTYVYGQAFNPLTGEQYRPYDLDELKDAPAFTIGHGKEEFYIVTDPLCPYCMNLEKNLSKYEELATFHIIMISLPMHKDAPQAIKHVLQSEKKPEALVAIANGDKKYLETKIDAKSANEIATKMANMEKISRELGVRGTPSVFAAQGDPVDMGVFQMLDMKLAQKQQPTASMSRTDAVAALQGK